MRSSVEALERDITEIQAMASSIKPASDLLAKSPDPHVKTYLLVRRRFDYSAVIVALYASFEKFVEDILTSYVKIVSEQGNYGELPSKLVAKHLKKTAELLAKGDIDQARYPGVTPLQLIGNLFHCLSGNLPYQLNHIALAAHDKNIRYDELASFLNLVELPLESVRKAAPLLDWYHADHDMTGKLPEEVPEIVIKQRLNSLVQRRNDVAHRGGNPEDRLGAEEMQGLVKFVLALARSVFTLFVSQYLGKRYVGKAGCEQLMRMRGPYNQKHVWVVRGPSCRLHVSQPAFALSPKFIVRWGRVKNLQIDDTNQKSIDAGSAKSAGVELDFAVPANAELYVLGAEDDVIWSTSQG